MRGSATRLYSVRISSLRLEIVFQIALTLLSPGLAHGASSDPLGGERGKEIYEKHCAMCHDASKRTHAPTRASFNLISPEAVVQALSPGGIMQEPGKTTTVNEMRVLAIYLTGREFGAGQPAVPQTALCATDRKAWLPSATPGWNGWGVDAENSRFQPSSMAKLAAADVPKLKLKWAFAFPGASEAKAQPAVMGGRVFVGSAIRTIYSLDDKTGCIFWALQTAANVRTGIELARAVSNGRLLAYFADIRANVYAADAATGALVWEVNVDEHPTSTVTGTPKVHGGVIFVPLTTTEDVSAADPKYECCKTSGGLIALDAANGKQIWRTDTISEPVRQRGVNSIGVPKWGPSGAGVWSSPTLDLQRNVVYVTTGDNHSKPASLSSDAILAIDMKTGALLWSRQFTAEDAFNVGCLVADKANCPQPQGPDQDFGASAILIKLANGKRALIAAQKSGFVHAVDPDNAGTLLWQVRVAGGGLFGGVEWGIASDRKAVYVPVSDFGMKFGPTATPGVPTTDIRVNHDQGGGLVALDTATGQPIWRAPPVPCAKDDNACSPAQPAAVTAAPGVVFS